MLLLDMVVTILMKVFLQNRKKNLKNGMPVNMVMIWVDMIT